MATIDFEEVPESVEEAGALLGTTITRYDVGSYTIINPPKGTHSSFAIISPVPSSELFVRLHHLRALLRSEPKDTPLVAAPSLLAGVLMKLLGISNKLASSPNVDPTRRTATPPMLSKPLRKLWVDCVVLCHSLGEGLSGNARINIYGFVRNMISLAALNPRTSKAAGGTRIAALEAIEGIMRDPKLSNQLASWAFDVTHLCQRALKSSGNGDPSYRIAAVRTACSVVIASRTSFMNTRPVEGTARLVLKGALDDKAILEMVKLIKTATQDKFVEVRTGAAKLAGLLAPLVIHTTVKSSRTPDAAASPTASLEDLMTLAFKNLDDASAECAASWAEALARCMSTAIEVGNQKNAEETSQRDVEGGGGSGSTPGKDRSNPANRKGILPASMCSTLPQSLKYLVSVFVKAGGELVAPRTGGMFSTGGRAVRIGFARSIIQLLRLQSSMKCIGEGKSISYKEAILIILSMVGTDVEAQLSANEKVALSVEALDATSVITATTVRAKTVSGTLAGQSSSNTLFGQTPKISHADAGTACLTTSRVLREGLLDLAPETTQLAILHEFINLSINRQKHLKGHQLQVILTEISHLFARLGEAAASALDEISQELTSLLQHTDHGVRHEAAVVCASITTIFPSWGRKLVAETIGAIQVDHASLMAIASSGENQTASSQGVGTGRFRFGRRSSPVKGAKTDNSMKHQNSIHGKALMVTILIQTLPTLPAGLQTELLDDVMTVAEILSSTYFNDILAVGNPSGVCTCVRAGFAIICGVLSAGPGAVTKHVNRIFDLWKKANRMSSRGNSFTADHEMICMESMLSSIVAFLKYCSELLLSVPDALSKTTLILEELLPLFQSDGRLGKIPANPAAASRLDSAKACLMEAFSWLPPGSFPMVADSVFTFASKHIQMAIENDVSCSILRSLISKEDMILDSVSFSRASYPGQVGGTRDLENDIIIRKAEAAHHTDRESAMYLSSKQTEIASPNVKFLDSKILGMLIDDNVEKEAPTVLHEVGNWLVPATPFCSSKIRLVDASIQAFAAGFSLKSGKEQMKAMKILESIVPPINLQSPRSMGATLSEGDRRGKVKEHSASFANIAAVLVSCLKSLPIQESSKNVPIGIGPTWMTVAKSILLNIFSSRSPFVRRAAAEGLSILSTLGVNEDAHFLQSAILHSLDEVIKGNYFAGQGRPVLPASVSSASAAALLTFASIQRSAHRIRTTQLDKARNRGSPVKKTDADDLLPTLQILIRIIPSIDCGRQRGFFGVRTYALHAFGLLLAYPNKFKGASLNANDMHLLKKSVEIVEDNFLSAWTTVSSEQDLGTESEKLSFEPCFLAVLLRLMSFLLPSLHKLKSYDTGIASRFAKMASIIAECGGSHPTVAMESTAFFELLAEHQQLLPPHAGGLKYDEHPLLCCLPFLMNNLAPTRSLMHPLGRLDRPSGFLSCATCTRATVRLIKLLSNSDIWVVEWSDVKVVSLLMAALEDIIASRLYVRDTLFRSLAAPREVESAYSDEDLIESEILELLRLLVYLEGSFSDKSTPMLLRIILLSRSILLGISSVDEDFNESSDGSYTVAMVAQSALRQAVTDAFPILSTANPARWQVKAIAIQVATIALKQVKTIYSEEFSVLEDSAEFNPRKARLACLEECRQADSNQSPIPKSRLALHMVDLINTSCAMATATVDDTELRILQESAMHLLSAVISCFGSIPDPDQPDTRVLNDYVLQISSCVKSALGAPIESKDAATSRLFLCGCETLQSFLQSELTSDKAVLKKIIRPALPSVDDVPSTFHDSKNQADAINSNELLIRIGKFWTLGNIPMDEPEIMTMLKADKSDLGAYLAALAVDGACLLLASKLSLSGGSKENTQTPMSYDTGFCFGHVDDIDDIVKAALVKRWALCACMAVTFLSEEVTTGSERQDQCELWLRKAVPLLFAGIYDSVSHEDTSYTPEWVSGMDSSDITCSCLQGINALVGKYEVLDLDEEWRGQVDLCVGQVSEHILLPVLSSGERGRWLSRDSELVSKACTLIQSLTKSPAFEIAEDSSLLLALLRPLEKLQNEDIDLTGEQTGLVVSTCLESIGAIISKSTTPQSLVNAMLNLVFTLAKYDEIQDNIRRSSQYLLKECLKHEAVSAKDQSLFAYDMAKARKWEIWSVIVKESDAFAAKGSLDVVQSILSGSSLPEEKLEAVRAILGLIQNAETPSPLVGRIVATLAIDVLTIFQEYGTQRMPSKDSQSKRTEACADCMKIELATLQQFVSDNTLTDDEISKFLVILFMAFVSVVRFNGLPNHPLPQAGLSDPAIGRMCAQAMVHVARVAALPFKASMALMSEQDRAVVEFAVRAEMSGYATAPSQAPVKKKLNLNSFKK